MIQGDSNALAKKPRKTQCKTLRSSHFIISARFLFQTFDIHVTYEINKNKQM